MAKKSFGKRPWLALQPVLMIGTYDEKGNPDLMMSTWSNLSSGNHVALNLENDHKTLENIRAQKAFSVMIPSSAYVENCDYCGIVSQSYEKDKIDNCGLHFSKAEKVNAPIVDEFDLIIECTLEEDKKQIYGDRILGRIENVQIDERIIDEKGNPDAARIDAFFYDPISQSYIRNQQVIAKAFEAGARLMSKNKSEPV